MLERAPAVCLTCDGWTNINSVSFYAITAHFFDPHTHLNLNSILLECSEFSEKHTAKNISSWIKNVANKFKIDFKICAVVMEMLQTLRLQLVI